MNKRNFSRRFGYDPNQSTAAIAEDAPQWLRLDYFNQILEKLLYIDLDNRQKNEEDRPLGVKQLHKNFCTRIRQEMDERAFDTWYAYEELKERLMSVEWYHFYDFIELVAETLRVSEDDHPFDDEWVTKFGLEAHRRELNALFAENKVVWRIDRRGILTRENTKILAERTEEVRDDLKDHFSPARLHYIKAHRFLFEHPTDPENAIKEIISAVESVARTLYPQASTLGKALNEARRAQHLPPLLISVMEKYYAYANAEPAVRHGASVPSRVIHADAEFVFYTGVALVRYLIASSNEPNPE